MPGITDQGRSLYREPGLLAPFERYDRGLQALA
jgi:hypothetical protein